jgi:hypothetical protein
MTAEDLPKGAAPQALSFPHLPTRQQAFVWRNWELVPPPRLADVLSADVDTVLGMAADMGLSVPPAVSTHWLSRGHVTIIRANWHLLPYDQLLTLLGWTAERMAYVLKEDDFLYAKLGQLKPQVAPLRHRALTVGEQARTRLIRDTLTRHFPERGPAADAPFGFLAGLETPAVERVIAVQSDGLRLIYDYAAMYGDTLMDDHLDPYPDGLLARYAAQGINGIWLQAILYTLVAYANAPAYGSGHAQRLQSLRRLVKRAQAYGIGVYLYLNEPRSMSEAFFAHYPKWKGVAFEKNEVFSMCTSQPGVLERLREATAELFRQVPDLAGVFTISMSENLTHCWSRNWQTDDCPVCSRRPPEDVVAEVNNAIEEGVHSAAPDAKVIAWSWSWFEPWAKGIVDRLHPGIELMCTSEDWLRTNVGGVDGKVIDYTMSQVGPSEHSKRIWAHARERGLTTHAKIQINNTWECSAVPYIPVPYLVAEHLQGIKDADVTGLMLSWTVGGYPGANLDLLHQTPEQLAADRYGAAAEQVVSAWKIFSEAFRAFPFSVGVAYVAPQNLGCANLLYPEQTGYKACMVGVPYDDLESWHHWYPAPVFEAQFKQMTEGWLPGLQVLETAAESVADTDAAELAELTDVAQACYCHLRTAYLQTVFVRLRDERGFVVDAETEAILREEIALATTLHSIMRRDSRIGFEATNHYFYTANDLMEKVLNCEYLLAERSGDWTDDA